MKKRKSKKGKKEKSERESAFSHPTKTLGTGTDQHETADEMPGATAINTHVSA